MEVNILDNKQLRNLLINARQEKGLTHQQVAKQASDLAGKSITRQYYGMIENGERRPSVDVAQVVARILNLNWTIFLKMNATKGYVRR